MPIFEFEIVDARRGWICVRADSIKDAIDTIKEDGFDAEDTGSEYHHGVEIKSCRQRDEVEQ